MAQMQKQKRLGVKDMHTVLDAKRKKRKLRHVYAVDPRKLKLDPEDKDISEV